MQPENLLVIQVMLPILLGLLCYLIPSKLTFMHWLLALVTSIISTVMSIFVFYMVQSNGPILYNMGGWDPKYGIQLMLDPLNSTIIVLVSCISVISLAHSYITNAEQIPKRQSASLYSALLIYSGAMVGVLESNDAFNIYVFLEILSITGCIMAAVGKNKYALIGAIKYLINGTIGASFYLIGIGILYSVTGNLNIPEIYNAMVSHNTSHGTTLQLAVTFMLIGLSLKIALFPMHNWLVKVYSNSCSLTTIFFSGTSSKIFAYLLIKIMYCMVPYDIMAENKLAGAVMLTLALCSIVFGSIMAMMQKEIRPLLAYSSISQIGFIVCAVFLRTESAIAAAVLYIIHHSLTKVLLFMTSSNLEQVQGNQSVENFSTPKKDPRAKFSSYLMILGLISMIGIPATTGFVSKWFITSSVIGSENWMIALPVVASSFITLLYSSKILKLIYRGITQSDNQQHTKQNSNNQIQRYASSNTEALRIYVCPAILGAAVLILGVYPTNIITHTSKIASYILTKHATLIGNPTPKGSTWDFQKPSQKRLR